MSELSERMAYLARVTEFDVLLNEHGYVLQASRGAICTCGHVPPSEPETLTTQQEYHRRHVVAVLADHTLRYVSPETLAERVREAVEAALAPIEALFAGWDEDLTANRCPACFASPETDCDHGEGYHHAYSDLKAAIARTGSAS